MCYICDSCLSGDTHHRAVSGTDRGAFDPEKDKAGYAEAIQDVALSDSCCCCFDRVFVCTFYERRIPESGQIRRSIDRRRIDYLFSSLLQAKRVSI